MTRAKTQRPLINRRKKILEIGFRTILVYYLYSFLVKFEVAISKIMLPIAKFSRKIQLQFYFKSITTMNLLCNHFEMKKKNWKTGKNEAQENAVEKQVCIVISMRLFDKNTAANWRFTSINNCNAFFTSNRQRTREKIEIFHLCWFTRMLHAICNLSKVL